MADFNVPLIIRGRIIEGDDIEFAGRRGGASFSGPDVRKHLRELVLARPSDLSDLYDLKFDEVLDFLEGLGERLSFGQNPYMREAYELSRLTSGLTDDILQDLYKAMPYFFRRSIVRQVADETVGIPYLDGWVKKDLATGSSLSTRAFGARAVHIVAGNSPHVSANTVMRNSITRSDMILKTPSNDPLTAAAIARTMIDFDPTHPITKHISVAYWKGGDTEIEEEIYTPRRIEKIIAWGGVASISHISKYIQPGIDLITLDPKLSSTIIGAEAFDDPETMSQVAVRLAHDIGARNQEGCVNARVIYVETGVDEAGVSKANAFGKAVFDAIQKLPSNLSGPAKEFDPALREELEALRWADQEYKLYGGGDEGAIIVSQTDEPVDFARLLAHRVANLVPIDDLEIAVSSVTAYTQSIGIYPEALKNRLRDRLAFHGAQRLTSLGYASGGLVLAGPQDGIEPLRRMCKWITEEWYDPAEIPLATGRA